MLLNSQRCSGLFQRGICNTRPVGRGALKQRHVTTAMSAINVLVVAGPDSPELTVLKKLPENVRITAIGREASDFAHLSDTDLSAVDVLLNCGVGKNAGRKEDIQACKWEPYDVEELRRRTFGVVGYGDIGQACARLAKAFKMRVVALRRRTTLTEAEKQENVLDALYAPDQLHQLMAESDYIVMATPYTPSTHHLIDAAAIAAMKPTGVLINVGRGKCIEEPALIEALQQRKIRGAALDVFYTEPLPESSPLWRLDNVFMSPHCADRTTTFQFESIELFAENAQRFATGLELLNVCDKTAGY